MKLKHTIYLSVILVPFLILFSCNDTNDDYGPYDLSSDARIASFSLSAGTYKNKADSTNYPILASTKFTIDQNGNHIYNVDSLPFGIDIQNLMPTLSYTDQSGSPSQIDIIYRSKNDSIATWNGTDSIDFSNNDISLKITAQDGVSTRTYNIMLRIHQIDPDSLVWEKISSLSNVPYYATERVILYNNMFYRYYLNGSTISLQTAQNSGDTPAWSGKTINGLNGTIAINNISAYEGSLYAINSDGSLFKSEDGAAWQQVSPVSEQKLYRILGIIPGSNSQNDSLLVVTKNGEDYYLNKTKDLLAFGTQLPVTSVYDYESFLEIIDSNFFAYANYDETSKYANFLTIMGVDNTNTKIKSWLFSAKDMKLTASKNSEIETISDKRDFTPFFYNDQFYAVTNDSLYISSDWGKQWKRAADSEQIHETMKSEAGQTIITDENNFVWLFGNMSGTYNVWRGRLNKLIK